MKGVILAGGTGSRLYPCTKVTNKHLLPVYNKPMIFHPIETLVSMGIKDIMIVTGGESIGDFMKLLGSGKEHGIQLTYRIQDEPKGIAHALLLAEQFAAGERLAVILGDNIIENAPAIPEGENAVIFIKEVDDPERFGVATVVDGRVSEITEKPRNPRSRYAVIGLYVYPPDVFNFIKKLQPSHRGELEITDVNNYYIKKGMLDAIQVHGYWSDAGTFDSLLRASTLVARMKK